MNIGQKIKFLRRKNDLTQEKLADLLGVSYQAVSKWETGISCPDLALIAPLTKLLHVSADELLGLTDVSPDKNRAELEEAYQQTWKNGDLEARYCICKTAVREYPKDMEFLNRFAWAEAMRAFSFADDTECRGEQEKAVRRWARVIEDTPAGAVRSDAIRGIVQYLSILGRREEAAQYAELYPDGEQITKDAVRGWCLVGEEKMRHHQRRLDHAMLELLNLLGNTTPQGCAAQESILKTLIPDGNYLYYHWFLRDIRRRQAVFAVEAGKYAQAIELLRDAFAHAAAYDKIDRTPGVYRYTGPYFDRLEFDSVNLCRTGTESLTEELKKALDSQCFEPLGDLADFRMLTAK